MPARVRLALTAVLLLPSAAAAGPLPWGFQVYDAASGLDRVVIEQTGLGAGEVRVADALPRPTLGPPDGLPNPRTYQWETYTDTGSSSNRKVRVWMGQDDLDHDAWRWASWSVSRVYARTADGSGWQQTGTRELFWPADGNRSVMEFDNGNPDDGLVNRVEMRTTEFGTVVFQMTPDVTPAVPEPTTLALAAAGLAAAAAVRRRR